MSASYAQCNGIWRICQRETTKTINRMEKHLLSQNANELMSCFKQEKGWIRTIVHCWWGPSYDLYINQSTIDNLKHTKIQIILYVTFELGHFYIIPFLYFIFAFKVLGVWFDISVPLLTFATLITVNFDKHTNYN